MPLRINSRQITTSLSPHEQRAQIANLVRNHGLGFGLHSLPKNKQTLLLLHGGASHQTRCLPLLGYWWQLHVTSSATVSASQATNLHELGTIRRSKQPPKPSASTQSMPSDKYMPRDYCPSLKKGYSHRTQWLIHRHNLNSTASHKIAMHTTQHRSLHAPTKHRRCTPRNREYYIQLVKIHITWMCNQYLQ
jgi:hypothetical protein